MGMVMGMTAVILGIAAALGGVTVGTALLFPRRTACARSVLERRPGRCFVMGALLVALLGVPVIALMQPAHGLAKMAGWSLTFPLAAALIIGLAAMAELLGERMRELSPGTTPLGGLVRGVMTLELALVLPVFGWFVLTPMVGLTLLGAGALGTLSAGRPQTFRKETAGHQERVFP